MANYILTPIPPAVNVAKTYTTHHVCRLLGNPGRPLSRMSLWRFAKKGLIAPLKPQSNLSLYTGEEVLRCWDGWWNRRLG